MNTQGQHTSPYFFLAICLIFVMACKTDAQQEQSANALSHPVLEQVQEKEVKQDTFSLEYLMGKFDPATHPAFVAIDPNYADRSGMYLHKETYAAFIRMYEAALADDIHLQIRSATRNFNAQKEIWEGKWTGARTIENGKDASIAYPDATTRALKILEYSSMPGSSRHHWGTDIDLNSFQNGWFEEGEGKAVYDWLKANAATFGFCQPYTVKGPERPNGYNEERWHWSYLPLAQVLTQKAQKELTDETIEGFMGSSTATEIGIVSNYVLGINPSCLPL